MRRLITLVVLILIMLMAVGGMIAQTQNSHMLSFKDRQRIQNKFSEYIGEKKFSGTVYAVYQGKVLYDQGFGNATTTLRNSTDIAYGVASVTKEFTATAIMQLVERGQLKTTDKLSKFFPGYKYGDELTVWHLLAQRSGIPDFSVSTVDDKVVINCYTDEDKEIIVDPNASAQQNRDKIRAFFLSEDLMFEPGEYYDYSDSNYSLLAEIVARVSGMEFHDFIRQNIFEPLNMENSAFIDDYDPAAIPEVAQTDRLEFNRDYFTVKGVEYGCGDILTTPKDLYLWYRGLTSGKVVSDKTYREMTANYSKEDELGYGYGLMISEQGEKKVIYHYGYIPSYCSAIMFVPEIDYFQVVLSNHDVGNPHLMAADLARYFGGTIDIIFSGIE